MNEITVAQLEQAFQRIVAKLRSEGVTTVQVATDAYRFVPADAWTDFANDEILVGSLREDIEGLKNLVADPSRYCTYVDVDRFSAVLKAISQELNPPG